MTNNHLQPADHDGTAIDWDSECLRTPGPSRELVMFTFALGLAFAGAVGFALWCAWGEP